ncbi:MAG: alpha/beta hydrolase [Sphingomonadaceae bacterium]
MRTLGLCIALAPLALGACLALPPDEKIPVSSPMPPVVTSHYGEVLSGSIHWSVDMPAEWNGTLLVFSRGYSQKPDGPQTAPPAYRDQLLQQGYALAASDYGSGGWALAEAVPAQEQVIEAFAKRYGKPSRVIGWGNSMGGLVTTALAEKPRPEIDGGLAVCSSIGGSLGMMNMALDGAFAFKALVVPDKDIKLVRTGDDRANGVMVESSVQEAMQTPEGRARVALAGVLAGIPGWTEGDAPPAGNDIEAQVEQIAFAFSRGVFLPRADQENRAGGVFSWNENVDYTTLLARSERQDLVKSLYAKAGISLVDDLSRLDKAPRIKADKQAIAYMAAHYTPNGRPQVPLLALQAVGDGMTSPSLQRAYEEVSNDRMMQSLYTNRAGHCTLDAAEMTAALHRLEYRISLGVWQSVDTPFIEYTPPPMPRSCFTGKSCQ